MHVNNSYVVLEKIMFLQTFNEAWLYGKGRHLAIGERLRLRAPRFSSRHTYEYENSGVVSG